MVVTPSTTNFNIGKIVAHIVDKLYIAFITIQDCFRAKGKIGLCLSCHLLFTVKQCQM